MSKKTAHDFVEFLVREGVIDSHRADAFKEIWSARLKFGIVAVREKFVSTDDLFEVLEEQMLSESNVKIGELFLEKNLLTPDQVDRVLELQKGDNIIDLDFFADTGLLPREVLEKKLAEYLDK